MAVPQFDDYLARLQDQARAASVAHAAPGFNRRAWQLPVFPSVTPLRDPAALVAACDRGPVNQYALEVYSTGAAPNSGRLGQLIAAKIAIDHMGAAERALHARHAGALRLRAWAAARRAGHAEPDGVFGALGRTVSAWVYQATAQDNSPPPRG
jgi:hypothetical protein